MKYVKDIVSGIDDYVEVTSIRRGPSKGFPEGRRIVAFIDFIVLGIAVNGCKLVEKSGDNMFVAPPTIDGPETGRRSVAFLDPLVRNALLKASRNALRALQGVDYRGS